MENVRGNISSSTFRFVLASLLLDELELKPRATIKKVVLDANDNVRLRQWQVTHLSVTWCERPQPWDVEDAVIALMQPPLNSAAKRRIRSTRPSVRRERPSARWPRSNWNHERLSPR